MFRESFKYYKSRESPPDPSRVIDVENHDSNKVKRSTVSIDEEFTSDESLGLRWPKCWEIFQFPDIPGLVFIKNPFTNKGQRYWMTKCLRDYTRKPYRLNLDVHHLLGEGENWWDICTDDDERGKHLASKLRWATLGYHHNWNTKLYCEDSRDDVPAELCELTATIARVLNFREFKAEAAIINYYRMNSTLAGHTDRSELDHGAPLFSISFGQSALYLIGGSSLEDPASAILLRSGDVVVMSGESRLGYHGIPKILPAENLPWESYDRDDESCSSDDWRRARAFVSRARINITVRQVLKNGQTRLPVEKNHQ